MFFKLPISQNLLSLLNTCIYTINVVLMFQSKSLFFCTRCDHKGQCLFKVRLKKWMEAEDLISTNLGNLIKIFAIIKMFWVNTYPIYWNTYLIFKKFFAAIIVIRLNLFACKCRFEDWRYCYPQQHPASGNIRDIERSMRQ